MKTLTFDEMKAVSIGTNFHNITIDCTVIKLIEILGIPWYYKNDGKQKTNYDWAIITKEGYFFTVYDYKYNRPLSMNELVEWHIGAKNISIATKAKKKIILKLNEKLKK